MKIRFIGDIHGDFVAYDKITEDVEHSIQVGDFGKGFGPTPEHMPLTHRFIRGNHDCLDLCIEDKHWIPDGFCDTLFSKKFGPINMMFIGGAWSIDKEFRIPGKDWWSDEEISMKDMQGYYDTYMSFKPDIMVTHDLPSSVSKNIFQRPVCKTKTGEFLNELFEAHKPKIWFAGHWHENRQIVIDNTRFTVLGINAYVDIDFGEIK